MKDAYERRALLLHLGDVLEGIDRLLSDGLLSVHDLVVADKDLERFTWLSQLSPGMQTEEFVRRAARGFCSWPIELLEPELNHERLALTVQRSVFADNPEGWRAYAGTLQQQVGWFGTGVPWLESAGQAQGVNGDADPPDSPDSGAVRERLEAHDIERDTGQRMPGSRESVEGVEGGSGFYPSWPWKSGA